MPKTKKQPKQRAKRPAAKPAPAPKKKVNKGLKVKLLEKEFESGGYTFTRIAEQDNWAVYHKHKPSHTMEECEVIRIDLRPLHPNDPNPEKYDLHEAYPAPSRWGRHGFTVIGKARAIAFMTRKVKEAKERKK